MTRTSEDAEHGRRLERACGARRASRRAGARGVRRRIRLPAATGRDVAGAGRRSSARERLTSSGAVAGMESACVDFLIGLVGPARARGARASGSRSAAGGAWRIAPVRRSFPGASSRRSSISTTRPATSPCPRPAACSSPCTPTAIPRAEGAWSSSTARRCRIAPKTMPPLETPPAAPHPPRLALGARPRRLRTRTAAHRGVRHSRRRAGPPVQVPARGRAGFGSMLNDFQVDAPRERLHHRGEPDPPDAGADLRTSPCQRQSRRLLPERASVGHARGLQLNVERPGHDAALRARHAAHRRRTRSAVRRRTTSSSARSTAARCTARRRSS